MFETQLDEICLFPLQNKKNSFTFDDKKADEVAITSTTGSRIANQRSSLADSPYEARGEDCADGSSALLGT